jgi:mannitol-1-phosphate 5-dehydrogenase
MELLVFGAGNIGRSFVGQLFARAGYRVAFVDVNDALVDALNRQGGYRIEVRDRRSETIRIEGVSALHGRDREQVVRHVAAADIAATAVGTSALPHIYPAIAAGIAARHEARRPPLDIIICENLRGAAEEFARGLREHLPAGFPLESAVGLIETSIGKMVPIVPDGVRREDPLVLYAEAYNTLILDANGFKNPVPEVPGLDAKENMRAYVDRKAFIHNCGHAACAYVGYLANPNAVYVWEVAGDPGVQELIRQAMWESGRSLIRRYPEDFDDQNQHEHIEDLIARFCNRGLGDTIFRVGRDLRRKLSREDRLVGALLMDLAEGIGAPATTAATAAGFLFRGADEHGSMLPADADLVRDLDERGPHWAVQNVCGLRREVADDASLARDLTEAYTDLSERSSDWLAELLERVSFSSG